MHYFSRSIIPVGAQAQAQVRAHAQAQTIAKIKEMCPGVKN